MDNTDRDSDDVGDAAKDAGPEGESLDGGPALGNSDELDSDAAVELGTGRYLLAAFFALGMVGAYVLSRAIVSVWGTCSNRDWFARAVPTLASMSEEARGAWSTLLAALVALVLVVRTYRRPKVRAWGQAVVQELAKCVWPSKRDVTNYTTVVIVVSLLCTAYLTVLDRLYAFVTSLVYGSGS